MQRVFTRPYLTGTIKNIKKSLDVGGHAGAFFIDILKTIDCTDHELLVTKLEA